jgi:hypothetical protein
MRAVLNIVTVDKVYKMLLFSLFSNSILFIIQNLNRKQNSKTLYQIES